MRLTTDELTLLTAACSDRNPRADQPVAVEPLPLTDLELEQLGRLLRNPATPTVHDLLAYGGVRTVSGLMARLVVAEPYERVILLTAIRRALAGTAQV
ncbi:MAG TPA: hypothetical protein VM779_02555 [Thermoanaerobaculia bacterium]|nr:hypothetical protein [Thermoanaerobaculia bacterium]